MHAISSGILSHLSREPSKKTQQRKNLKTQSLRLTQILEDQLHLPSREVAVIDTIARSEQRGKQAMGVVDVAVEATQRIGGRADGEVHRGEFALGVGADFNHCFHSSLFTFGVTAQLSLCL